MYTIYKLWKKSAAWSSATLATPVPALISATVLSLGWISSKPVV